MHFSNFSLFIILGLVAYAACWGCEDRCGSDEICLFEVDGTASCIPNDGKVCPQRCNVDNKLFCMRNSTQENTGYCWCPFPGVTISGCTPQAECAGQCDINQVCIHNITQTGFQFVCANNNGSFCDPECELYGQCIGYRPKGVRSNQGYTGWCQCNDENNYNSSVCFGFFGARCQCEEEQMCAINLGSTPYTTYCFDRETQDHCGMNCTVAGGICKFHDYLQRYFCDCGNENADKTNPACDVLPNCGCNPDEICVHGGKNGATSTYCAPDDGSTCDVQCNPYNGTCIGEISAGMMNYHCECANRTICPLCYRGCKPGEVCVEAANGQGFCDCPPGTIRSGLTGNCEQETFLVGCQEGIGCGEHQSCVAVPPSFQTWLCFCDVGYIQNADGRCIEAPIVLPELPGQCSASGDPHYMSFGGIYFDWQNRCPYIAARSISKDLEIHSVSDACGGFDWNNDPEMQVSCVAAIAFTRSNGDIIEFALDGAFLNGTVITGNMTLSDGGVIYQSQYGWGVTYPDNVKIEFQGWGWSVTVPAAFAGTMTGMCANFDTTPGDDLQIRNGSKILDQTFFKKDWMRKQNDKQLLRNNTCRNGGPQAKKSLAPRDGSYFAGCSSNETLSQAFGLCNFLINPPKEFEECFSLIDIKTFYYNCLFDYCALESAAAVNDTISAVASRCSFEVSKNELREQYLKGEEPLSTGSWLHVSLLVVYMLIVILLV